MLNSTWNSCQENILIIAPIKLYTIRHTHVHVSIKKNLTVQFKNLHVEAACRCLIQLRSYVIVCHFMPDKRHMFFLYDSKEKNDMLYLLTTALASLLMKKLAESLGS